MKMLFLLILLSQNGAGDITASFVNTETQAQCEQKTRVVEGIFTTAKIPILKSTCVASELRFSEFTHGDTTSQTRYFYLISLTPTEATINSATDWRACMLKQDMDRADSPVYCASSVQKQIR